MSMLGVPAGTTVSTSFSRETRSKHATSVAVVTPLLRFWNHRSGVHSQADSHSQSGSVNREKYSQVGPTKTKRSSPTHGNRLPSQII